MNGPLPEPPPPVVPAAPPFAVGRMLRRGSGTSGPWDACGVAGGALTTGPAGRLVSRAAGPPVGSNICQP